MNYDDKINDLARKNMTEISFSLWREFKKVLPDFFSRPTSTTGKYHKKANGSIPTTGEHVYEMLYAAQKLFPMFNILPNSTESDIIFLAILFHDSLKYGKFGEKRYSDKTHDKNAADMIKVNEDVFLKIFSEEQHKILEEAVRFHSGRWSTDNENKEIFDFKSVSPITFFVHLLDMFSTQDLIQTDVREKVNDIDINKSDTRTAALA